MTDMHAITPACPGYAAPDDTLTAGLIFLA